MDLTTLTYALLIALGLLGLDAALHPPDAILEAQSVGTYDKTTISADLVNEVLTREVERISATPTIMTKPVITIGRLQGLAMGLAEATNMQALAYAVQAQFGSRPDQIKISLFGEGGSAKVLVSGTGRRRMASFRQELTLEPNETVVRLLERATMVGMAHIDPYITALSELQAHAEDKDFAHAEAIIRYALDGLPPTPENFERSLFENLNGLIALFRGDATGALAWFKRAEASCPDKTVADAVTNINAAFAEMQIDRDAEAVRHVEWLLREKPPTDKVLLSTAYMTLAAARLGTGDVQGADSTIALAVETYPEAASAFDLWADVKREKGDEAAAARLHRKALENSVEFENYGEIATLYFRLAWRENQPVMRSPFRNPELGNMRSKEGKP